MVTNRGDVVLDPFGGSCVTVEVTERFGRHWTCVESKENYLKGGKGRFCNVKVPSNKKYYLNESRHYKIRHPGILWDENDSSIELPADGGKKRIKKSNEI